MCNLAISILTVTYEIYSHLENGLFYNELLNILAEYEYDNKFGFLSCSYTPIYIFFPIIIPVFEYYDLFYEEDVNELNETICNLLYFPIFIIIICVFVCINLCLVPLVFLWQIIKMFNKTIRLENRQLESLYFTFVFAF